MPAEPGGLGHRLILVLALGIGAHLALASIGLLVTGGGEELESALYVAAFLIVLPGALAAGTVLSGRLERAGALGPVALLVAGGLLGLLVLARLVYTVDDRATIGTPLFAAGLALWGVGTAILIARATRGRLTARPGGQYPGNPRLVVVPGALLALLLFGFAPSRLFGAAELAAVLVLVAVLLGAYSLLLRRSPGRRLGVVLDVVAVAALVLLFNDVQLYSDAEEFFSLTSNLHQNFYLGPANDVLHGRPMLIETFSQYGAGVFYFLAGWFSLAEIGYGAMTLLSALLCAVQIAVIYAIPRLAGASRPLAFTAGAVAGAALFFSYDLPAPTSHPSLGGLRYLLPYAVIALATAGARSSRPGRGWWWAVAACVGLASVWSVETFTYCAAALAGVAAVRGALGPRSVRGFAGTLVPAAVAVIVAHLGYAVLTRALAGKWPDWGGYFAFLGSYSVDGISALPIEPWSPGIAMCAVYFASMAAAFLLARREAAWLCEEGVALAAIVGTAAFGFASFAYFIGNSYAEAALSIGLPACLVAALWLTILERRRAGASRPLRRVAAVTAAWMLASLAVFAWPAIEERAGDTPLAMALPDSGSGGSITNELSRMWRSDPLDARMFAEALVRKHFPGDGPVLAAGTTESTVTVLMQSDRINAFPVSHFLQESLVMERSWPLVLAKIESLESGDLLLTEARALAPVDPAPLLDRTIAELRRRFEFAFVDGDPNGFMVVRLTPRGP